MLSKHSVGIHQRNELTRNSSGNARPRSSQLAEPLWTDAWPKEWNWCARAEIHFYKKTHKGSNDSLSLPPIILACNEKPHTRAGDKCFFLLFFFFFFILQLY